MTCLLEVTVARIGQVTDNYGNAMYPSADSSDNTHKETLVHHRYSFLWLIFVLGLLVVTISAQDKRPQRRVRARLPRFDAEEASRIFFDDVFDRLIGERPKTGRLAETDQKSPAATSPAAIVSGSEESWSSLISAETIEDEVKALKLSVDRTVTTPGSFAGRGHLTARLDFTLLAMLFGIIDQYDGDVRWQESARTASRSLARAAANLKAGGSIQVYNEAKLRKQDLDDLVRGSRLSVSDDQELLWSDLVDRSVLMQLLEKRLEPDLKAWTSNDSAFEDHLTDVVHASELTTAIAAILAIEDMDDASDDEYREFAALLQQGGLELTRAGRSQSSAAASSAMSKISRSCVDCHDSYR